MRVVCRQYWTMQIANVNDCAGTSSVVCAVGNTGKYSIKPLSLVPNGERCVRIMAASFAKKEPLMVLAGVTEEKITSFASRIYEEASKVRVCTLSSS